jgi:anti-sigma B factor antagonist
MQAPVLNSSGMTRDRGQMGNGLRIAVTRVAMTSGGNLEISTDQLGKDVIVRPSGRINVYSSPDLRNSLLAILSREPLPLTVTVDLAGVSYVETSGIATLIEALRIARHHQIGFCLQGLNGSVLRLFEVTGALTLFEPRGREEKVS